MKYMVYAFILMMAATAFSATLQSTVPIKGGVLDVQMAKYDPIPAEAGKLVTIWFDVRNLGIETVDNASFILLTEYPFSLPNGDPERVYGRLTGLDDIRLEYKLLVETGAPNGTYGLKMKYSTEGRLFTEKDFYISVEKAGNAADLKALFVRAEPPAFPGSGSRLTVDVTNTDKGTAYYVIVRASSEAAFIERDSVFVGTLEANDFDSVDFDVSMKDVEPGIYPVNIEMTYKDKDSSEIEENDVVYMRLGSLDEMSAVGKDSTPGWMYIVYAFVLVVVLRLLLPFFRWLVKPLRKK